MKIKFYIKETGKVLDNTGATYFIMDDKVYCDNEFCTESQESSVSFHDFVEECPLVGFFISS